MGSSEKSSAFEEHENIDLKKLRDNMRKSPKPILWYLNIDSLRNKIIDSRYLLVENGTELLAVSETKLAEGFPDVEYYAEG